MRTQTLTLYKFNELTPEAQQTAIERYKDADMISTDFIVDEAGNTLKKFCDLFSITYRNFDFCEMYRSQYSFEMEDTILELSGLRLHKYIWNNFKSDLYKGKYYSLWSKKDISYKYYKEGYPVLKDRRSKVFFDTSAVLTGWCYDESILGPIYNFLDKPTSTDFKQLLQDCLYNFAKDVCSEIEAQYTDEVISENLIANEYEFTANGIMH